jgi:predicted TIM-barrel fold metal-dependent hydrolase
MTSNTLVSELFHEISKISCINSHSHLGPEANRVKAAPDILEFFGHAYPGADLISAGMSKEDMKAATSPGLSMDERWKLFEPYWKWIRLTGFSQCILEGVRDLLGFDDLTAANVNQVNEALQMQCKPGFYHTVLKQRSNIERSVVNMNDLDEVDRAFFLPLPRLNRFSMLGSAKGIEEIERDYNVSIGDLKGHVGVIQQVCRDWSKAKVAGIKLSQSYHRRMDFAEQSEDAAAAIFSRLLKGDYAGLNTAEGKVLEDYLVFECCRAASDANLTIQFHQGMRAANFGGMEGCSPAPLTDLMATFPEARFDLSHAGYPYLREGAVLGKTFSNVFLNMSWIHIISPHGSRTDLREWLRMVPYNKIIAFGDDLTHVEAVYGHLKMARKNFAVVLAEMVEEGLISESVALDIAQAAFYDNPAMVYGV